MTVAELIEELQKMPPYAPVWIQMVIGLLDEEEGTDSVVASNVSWQGNHVEIE